MLECRVHLSLQILLVLSSQLLASSTILTSDLGGDNDTVVLCPNEVITLTCQTISDALVWLYPDQHDKIFNSDNDINNSTTVPIDGGTIEFRLIDRMGTNYTSTAIVNTTTHLHISCSPDGSPSNAAVMIIVKDAPPSTNVSVVDTKIDHISLKWDHVPTADSYYITISPNPVGGACAGGTCSVINNSITIDDLPSDTFNFNITVNSVNCAGAGPSVMITEDTLPKAITEVGTDSGIIDDVTTFFVCPDESVNITCYTKQALIWLVSDMVEITYDEKSDTFGEKDYMNGFNFTLIEIDGVDFTSLVEPKMNTSYNISCSPTGKAKDPVNSDITVSVIDVLAQPTNFVIKTLCLNDAELEWDYDEGADDYYITVHPSPARGVCVDGICSDYLYVHCNETTNKCISVVDGLDDKEYVYSLRSINCAGTSEPATITDTVTVELPTVAKIVSLKQIDSDNDDQVNIFLEWTSPDISCQTPSIDNFTVIIVAYGDPVFHTVNCCNHTFELDRCGIYSFIVQPRNKVGLGPISLPETTRTGLFSMSTTLSKTTDDSASIEVTVSRCFIPAVTNVTILLSRQTADILQQLSLTYPNTSISVNQTIEELDSETEYNATVIIYYQESGANQSFMTMLSFTTSEESLLSLQNIVIGSLSGFGVLGIIIIVLIIVIGILCLRDGYRKKQIRRLTRRQTEHRTQLTELQHTVRETHANTEALAEVQRRTEAPVQHNQVASPNRLYPELTNEYANNTYL